MDAGAATEHGDDTQDDGLETDTPAAAPRRHGRWRRRLAIALGILLAVVIVVVGVTAVTPWPSAMLIRGVFERGGAATAAEMQRHVPDSPVRSQLGIPYDAEGESTTFDVFTTAAPGQRQPAVVWIHGGAWISGSSANVDPYLQILATRGWTTIGVNYSLGPERTYPTAVRQLNDALAFIQANADDLGVDPDRIVLAGDSAGAQLASQLAVLITNPEYDDLLGITPALQPSQLIGVILNCGVYDLDAMADLNGLIGWGFKTALWSYTGTKDWAAEYPGATMSTIEFATADFPPTFISGGNGDGLTWLQGIPMSQRLQNLGVDVTTLFWPADHEPSLKHEYQFHLDLPEAQQALTETEDFLAGIRGD